mmetsp:Transcript_37745/g.88250  ORF Transcript_37745/g.88250 Transcript_37745/m.88250 type:complete len:270 (-) Transcript_37745:308-1117(-)
MRSRYSSGGLCPTTGVVSTPTTRTPSRCVHTRLRATAPARVLGSSVCPGSQNSSSDTEGQSLRMLQTEIRRCLSWGCEGGWALLRVRLSYSPTYWWVKPRGLQQLQIGRHLISSNLMPTEARIASIRGVKGLGRKDTSTDHTSGSLVHSRALSSAEASNQSSVSSQGNRGSVRDAIISSYPPKGHHLGLTGVRRSTMSKSKITIRFASCCFSLMALSGNDDSRKDRTECRLRFAALDVSFKSAASIFTCWARRSGFARTPCIRRHGPHP